MDEVAQAHRAFAPLLPTAKPLAQHFDELRLLIRQIAAFLRVLDEIGDLGHERGLALGVDGALLQESIAAGGAA